MKGLLFVLVLLGVGEHHWPFRTVLPKRAPEKHRSCTMIGMSIICNAPHVGRPPMMHGRHDYTDIPNCRATFSPANEAGIILVCILKLRKRAACTCKAGRKVIEHGLWTFVVLDLLNLIDPRRRR